MLRLSLLVRARALASLLLLALGAACGAVGPTPPAIPAGTWVGEGARALVTAEGADLLLDCGGAAIAPPLSLDGEGRFDLPGWWERRAGPEPFHRRDARFRGRLQHGLLTVEIGLLDSTETLGPFELTLGGSGRAPVLCR
jgi:hypothetical protein